MMRVIHKCVRGRRKKWRKTSVKNVFREGGGGIAEIRGRERLTRSNAAKRRAAGDGEEAD